MPTNPAPPLVPWSDLAPHFDTSAALLLGNGFSITCWKHFHYASLYARAVEKKTLDEDAQRLFEALGTQGFEVVLETLRHAQEVARAWGEDTSRLDRTETTIRRALFDAVRDVHVPHTHLGASFPLLVEAFTRFGSIFTTNYDLIPYWSFMTAVGKTGSPPCIDFFHNGANKSARSLSFSRAQGDLDLAHEGTKLFYLHGALHLFQEGETVYKVKSHKSTSGNIRAILEWIEREHHEPLIVTEGQAARKHTFIRENAYLSWAFEQFERHAAPLVAFGHGLSLEADGHLLNVLNRWPKRLIALSVYPPDPTWKANAGRLDLLLRSAGHETQFFDGREHPLSQALCPPETSSPSPS